MDTATAQRLIQGKPWHHNFEIVPGVRTSGTYDPGDMWRDLELPGDLHGTSLADVGASNGYFSFEARKRGARVVAFDFRHKDNSGFGLAQHINGLTDIEHHQANVLDLSAEKYGQYDVVLALGLLYHISDPYRALVNCAGMARQRLLVESYCIDAFVSEELRKEPVMRFIADPTRFPTLEHVDYDRSNFWGFTSLCLRRMVEDIGFSVQRANVRHDRVLVDAVRSVADEQETRIPMAYGTIPALRAGADPDSPEAWTIF